MSYELIWRNKYLAANATSLDEMIQALQNAVEELTILRVKGVTLSAESDMAGDFAYLVTDDPAIANEYDFDLVDVEEADAESIDDLQADTDTAENTSASLAVCG
jgi:hypothetical protein